MAAEDPNLQDKENRNPNLDRSSLVTAAQADTSIFDPTQAFRHQPTPTPKSAGGEASGASRQSSLARPKQLLVKNLFAEQSHALAQTLAALLHDNHRSLDAAQATLNGYLDAFPQPVHRAQRSLASSSDCRLRSLPASPLKIPDYRSLQQADSGCLALLRSLDESSGRRLKNLSHLLRLADQYRQAATPHDLLHLVDSPVASHFYRSVNCE